MVRTVAHGERRRTAEIQHLHLRFVERPAIGGGDMSVSDAKRLKELETENARLKKLLAESVLENEVTREALRKKC